MVGAEPRSPGGTAAPSAARPTLSAFAGPALIVTGVIVVLHDVAVRGMLPGAYDLLGYWVPTHCYLGSTLAGGEVPGWNPFSMSGVPFAADPQSGWMYLPVMALFTTFSCDVAARILVVLQPVVAGLGLYAFLRTEGSSRPAATTGGLVLSLAVAGSSVVARIPFAGSLAWTAVLLACAARYLRAQEWPPRLVWLALSAVAWGTLAAAHFAHGLVIGTGALAAYLVARAVADTRARVRSLHTTLALVALLVVALVPVNLAFLLPRLRYLGDSTVGLGYDVLQQLGARVRTAQSTGLSWPLRFATSPGAYLGAVPLVLSLAWWSRERRELAIAFAAFGALCYLGGLEPVVDALGPVAAAVPLGDVYTRGADRLQYGVLLALPILAAAGVDAWRAAAPGVRRLVMLVPGALVWIALPLVVGVDPVSLVFLAGGAIGGGAALALVAVRPTLAFLIPTVIAVELSLNGLVGQAADLPAAVSVEHLGEGWEEPFVSLPEPDVDAAAFVTPGPIATTIGGDPGNRFFTEGVERLRRGGDPAWAPEEAGSLTLQRSMIFGIEDVQGYNPVQPLRYWTLVQRVNARPVLYNTAVLNDPSEELLDLLQVGWVVSSTDGSTSVAARQGPWTLERRSAPPRAEVIGEWIVAASPSEALDAVLAPGFDASRTAVLEADPGIPSGPVSGRATYRAVGTQRAEVVTRSPRAALLLLRIPYDDGWHATVDGVAVEVLAADYLFQAVPVPAGHHVVELRYEDATIGIGVLATVVSVTSLLAAALALALARRRNTRSRRPADARTAPPRGAAP